MSVYHDFAMNIDTMDWSDAYLEAQTDGRREEVELHKPYVYPPMQYIVYIQSLSQRLRLLPGKRN